MGTIEQLEKRQLKIFLVIAFGLPVIMGLFMWYGFNHNKILSPFAATQMYYPAAGVIIALLLTQKQNLLIPKAFFKWFLIQTVVLIGISISSIFIANKSLAMFSELFAMAGSVGLWGTLLLTKEEKIYAYGLNFKNRRRTIEMILLFVFLNTLRFVIIYLIDGDISPMIKTIATSEALLEISIILVNFFFNVATTFGEEYGWRYFLQPILQKRLGPIKGGALLGVLWGLWHLPLNFF